MCPNYAQLFLLQLDTEEVLRLPPPLLPLPLPLPLPHSDVLTLATAHRCKPCSHTSQSALCTARAFSGGHTQIPHTHTLPAKNPGPQACICHVPLNSTLRNIYWNNTLAGLVIHTLNTTIICNSMQWTKCPQYKVQYECMLEFHGKPFIIVDRNRFLHSLKSKRESPTMLGCVMSACYVDANLLWVMSFSMLISICLLAQVKRFHPQVSRYGSGFSFFCLVYHPQAKIQS